VNVSSNGTTLFAESEGDGPPVVFVHGMCGDARVWSDQVSRLRDQFQCVAYDRRGHTRSPRTDVAESVSLHADDLAGLIGALDLSPCYVVGSSGGARITVDLIRRYPSLVRAAVVAEPPIGAVAPDEFTAMIGQIAPKVQSAMSNGGARAAVDAFFEVMCPGLWASIDESVRDRYRDNAALLFTDLQMPPYQIDARAVSEIRVPTMMIGGTTSLVPLNAIARTMATWLPNGEFLEMDCGHVAYAERPEEFAREVTDFLQLH
jgi:pimeloyl-ACP methyl ester carboxylesterase